MGIFAPLVGFLVDRFGSRKLLLAVTMVIGLGLLVLSMTRSLAMFYMSFLLIALGVTFLIMGAGLLFFSFVRDVRLIVLFLLLFSPGFGGSMVLRGAIIGEHFGKASFGKMIGIVLGSASLGGIIGPTLAGYAFDRLGSYALVWQGLSVARAAAILLIAWMKPSRQVQEQV